MLLLHVVAYDSVAIALRVADGLQLRVQYAAIIAAHVKERGMQAVSDLDFARIFEIAMEVIRALWIRRRRMLLMANNVFTQATASRAPLTCGGEQLVEGQLDFKTGLRRAWHTSSGSFSPTRASAAPLACLV